MQHNIKEERTLYKEDDINIFALIHGENAYNKYIKSIEKNDLFNLFRINKEDEIIKEICKTILEIEFDGI